MEEAALGFLGEISQAATLRHAVQLLTPAHVLAKTNGAARRSPVTVCQDCMESVSRQGSSSRPCMCWLSPVAHIQPCQSTLCLDKQPFTAGLWLVRSVHLHRQLSKHSNHHICSVSSLNQHRCPMLCIIHVRAS